MACIEIITHRNPTNHVACMPLTQQQRPPQQTPAARLHSLPQSPRTHPPGHQVQRRPRPRPTLLQPPGSTAAPPVDLRSNSGRTSGSLTPWPGTSSGPVGTTRLQPRRTAPRCTFLGGSQPLAALTHWQVSGANRYHCCRWSKLLTRPVRFATTAPSGGEPSPPERSFLAAISQNLQKAPSPGGVA